MSTSTPFVAQASRLSKDLHLAGRSSSTIPRLVYGTAWKKGQTAEFVYKALRAGFRGVDTAAQPKHYNEPAVGEGVRRAVREGLISRDALFIQTKFTAPSGQNEVTPYDLNATLTEQVHQSVRSSLKNFTIEGQAPYLDSVVLHSPMDTIADTITVWKTLESHVPHEIRHLGISNASLPEVETLYEQMMHKPVVVQNRFHDRTKYGVKLRAYCRDKGIVFQSFWTLTANPALLHSQPVVQVAQSAGVEAAVALYSLVLGLEYVTILDGTTNEAHMKGDLEGLEKVGSWAETGGKADWEAVLQSFKSLIGEA